ncbi:hypothetical protein ACSS6W_006893 [Trichoderma asperelloides]
MANHANGRADLSCSIVCGTLRIRFDPQLFIRRLGLQDETKVESSSNDGG